MRTHNQALTGTITSWGNLLLLVALLATLVVAPSSAPRNPESGGPWPSMQATRPRIDLPHLRPQTTTFNRAGWRSTSSWCGSGCGRRMRPIVTTALPASYGPAHDGHGPAAPGTSGRG